MPEVTVLYLAHLRDQRGVDSERLATTAATARSRQTATHSLIDSSDP